MPWMKSVALTALLVAAVAPGTLVAGDATTLYVMEDGLALFVRPDAGAAPLPGEALAKGTAVVVVEEQAPFWVKVKPPQGLAGWTMQFSLTASAPVSERQTSRGIHRITRHSSDDMASTAGSLGIGELAQGLRGEGAFTAQDEALVDKITAYRATTDVQTFLKEGRLGRYMLSGK